jgi:hypothetical protein
VAVRAEAWRRSGRGEAGQIPVPPSSLPGEFEPSQTSGGTTRKQMKGVKGGIASLPGACGCHSHIYFPLSSEKLGRELADIGISDAC